MDVLLALALMVGKVGALMEATYGAGAGPPPTTYYITTEGADPITTEAGDRLVTENAP